MKSYIAIGALVAATASAQTITDLPSCSLNCIASSVLSICTSITDYACACKASDKLTASAEPCIQKACTSAADQQKVITVLEGICQNAGFPITISVPSSSAAPVSSSAAVSTPASSAAVTSAASSAAVSSAASVASSSSCTASTTYTTVTVKGTAPSSGPTSYPTASNGTVTTAKPTQYTGAAAANGVTFGAAGVLGLLAYLL